MKKLSKKDLSKLEPWNRNMLILMQDSIDKGVVDGMLEFLDRIDFPNHSNVYRIINSTSSFTHQHLFNASKEFNISMDWIYGKTSKIEFKEVKEKSLSGLLREASIMAKQLEVKIKNQ